MQFINHTSNNLTKKSINIKIKIAETFLNQNFPLIQFFSFNKNVYPEILSNKPQNLFNFHVTFCYVK